VEYPGYGSVKGKPTDTGILKNVITAYKFVTQDLNIDPRRLVIYGQSMGTGPAIFLGANPDFPIAGVITEGAFASGFKLFSKDVKFLDFYSSLEN